MCRQDALHLVWQVLRDFILYPTLRIPNSKILDII